MLTRKEREQIVLELYNQGKTIRDIAKEVRMSFRDIGAILRKEEKQERQNTQVDNNMPGTDGNRNLSGPLLSTQAYELFSQGKNPIQVAIELNLKESQVTKYHKEYWKLNGLHKLNQVHEEIKDDISNFLELYRSSKVAGMSVDHVIRLLEIANNNLPTIENKYKKLRQNVNHLESKELDLSITLEELKSQIQDAKQRLNSYRLFSQKEVGKGLQLHKENMRLSSLLEQFKNNNKEYLKIQYVANQTVKSTLSDKRRLLKIAVLSIIEQLHADPMKFDSLIRGTSSSLTMSKSNKIGQSGSNYQDIPFYCSNQNSYAETLVEVLVNEVANLYEKMVKELTNETMTKVVMDSSANLLPATIYSNEQTQTLISYRHKTQVHHNTSLEH